MPASRFTDAIAALLFYVGVVGIVALVIIALIGGIIWGSIHPRLADAAAPRREADGMSARGIWGVIALLIVVCLLPCIVIGAPAAWRVNQPPCGERPQQLVAFPELAISPPGARVVRPPAGYCSQSLHGATAEASATYDWDGEDTALAAFYTASLRVSGWVESSAWADQGTRQRFATAWRRDDSVLRLTIYAATPVARGGEYALRLDDITPR